MPLYEIVREDNVVIFQHAKSRAELERNFLLIQRVDYPEKSFVVFTLNEDLKRIGSKKKYIPYKDDKVTQENLKIRGEQLINDLFSKMFSGKGKIIIEDFSKNS